MWSYQNPVKILFGSGSFSSVTKAIRGRPFVLVTYPDKIFSQLSDKICSQAGKPLIIIDDITPNPDIDLLSKQVARFNLFKRKPEVIVALGGGSVIDTAKVFAAANGNIKNILKTLKGEPDGFQQDILPIIAVPTTAGTGSEVTCWATIWDKKIIKNYH
jgi:alcohol dehydrogenase